MCRVTTMIEPSKHAESGLKLAPFGSGIMKGVAGEASAELRKPRGRHHNQCGLLAGQEDYAMRHCGIDYHKNYSTACVLDENGEIVWEERLGHEGDGRMIACFLAIGVGPQQHVAAETYKDLKWLLSSLRTLFSAPEMRF